MSANVIEAADAADVCCASCGVAEIDCIKFKFKQCEKCDLARYCSEKCQQEHREIHEAICKERSAELREEILFRQPEGSHYGDCPICFLPLPLDVNKSTVYSCCSKRICKGCDFANAIREEEEGLHPKCPFCRKEVPTTQEECNKNRLKRAEANDPMALRRMGIHYYEEGDYDNALQYWSKAAKLGDAEAHFGLSFLYYKGHGVEKDEKMERYHLEEAAIAGHCDARYNLGIDEEKRGRFDKAVKHFIIAANLGDDCSLKQLKECYKAGHISKDDFASALRAHQAAVGAMKSPQREAETEAAAAVQ